MIGRYLAPIAVFCLNLMFQIFSDVQRCARHAVIRDTISQNEIYVLSMYISIYPHTSYELCGLSVMSDE